MDSERGSPGLRKSGFLFGGMKNYTTFAINTTLMTSKEIVAALKTRRKKMRLTQEDWAAKSGITQERISDYERGKAIPGIDSANKLAKGLGLDLVLVVPKFDDDEL